MLYLLGAAVIMIFGSVINAMKYTKARATSAQVIADNDPDKIPKMFKVGYEKKGIAPEEQIAAYQTAMTSGFQGFAMKQPIPAAIVKSLLFAGLYLVAITVGQGMAAQ